MAITRAQQAKQLLALGGRIGLQEGGIMPRLNQLGSGVSSAEQMLQGINQRLQSAESSLGSDGVRLPEISTNEIPFEFDNNRPGPIGIRPDFNAMVRPLGKPLQQLQQADPNSSLLGTFQSRPENTIGPMAQIPASGGLSGIPAARYADGGITSLQEPRQGYFLGKIVKKAKKAVKKVAKSPIGKAALAAALFKAGGGFKDTGFLKTKALPFLFGTQQMKPGIPGTPGLLDRIKGMGTLGQLGLIGGISGIAGLLAGREAEEEEDDFDVSKVDRGEGLDIDRIVRLARMNDPQFRFLPGAEFTDTFAEGGRINLAEGGLMSLGGMEMDLRGGGFVPIGAKEKADDVPARLSKNEFVMTADAVRAAGGGSIDKGADKMYNLMKDLESRV